MEKNNKHPKEELSPEEQLDTLLSGYAAASDEADVLPETPAPDEAAAELPATDDSACEITIETPQDTASESIDLFAEQTDSLEPHQEIPEIGPDEAALASVGLGNPDEMEFERIIAEAMQEEWGSDEDSDLPVAQSDPEETDTEQPEETTSAAEAQEGSPETAEEEEEPLPLRRFGKLRPKRRSTYGLFGIPHMITTVIWLALIAFVGIGLGNMAWEVASDVLALGRPDQTVVISIDDTDTLDTVADKLQQGGLIKYPGLFKLYGDITDAMDSIRRGSFTLSTQYDYHALVNAMSSNANRKTTKVVIPEGYNCRQIFALMEREGVCSAAELEEAAANAELGEYWFLEGVERGTPYCLEGYLFPDTYQFYLGEDPVSVLNKLLRNFDKRFTDKMKDKLDVLNENLSEMMRSHGLSEEYIAEHQMTIREVVIIASMIEKETANNAESYHISSVIYNRLTNPAVYPFLNIDATLVYITGHSPLTDADKKIDSPYNTYLYQGLIPGPISNPSRASLDAALDPESTEYHFYALNPATGTHHFSKTYQEHLDFLASLNKNED